MNQNLPISHAPQGAPEGLPRGVAPELTRERSTDYQVKNEPVIDSVAFLSTLETFVRSVNPVLADMEEQLETLKERMLVLLRQTLQAMPVDLENRVVIELDESGRLHLTQPADVPSQVMAQHDSALQHPELLSGMYTLAVHSSLVRCVEELQSLHQSARLPYTEGADNPIYHVCLKGPLSHFYFPR